MKNSHIKLIAMCCWLFSTYATAAELNQYKIEVWADNWFAAYLDGNLLLEDSVSINTERSFNAETYEFSAPNSFQLAFIIKDFKENDTGLEYIGSNRQQIGDGGFITQITNLDTGNIVGISDGSMRCQVIHKAPLDSACSSEANPVASQSPCEFISAEEPESWKTATFDDSAWAFATEYTAAQVSPKEGYDEILWDSSAKLIWSDDLEKDNTVLCRLAIGGTSGDSLPETEHTHDESHSHDELHSHFEHFDNVKTSEDSTYLLIESNGIPEHNMMEGITSWQQQVPLPQAYTGSNSWKIPLNPVLADNPILTKEHFHRGAIAIAVNGVPIFNALNNRGEYAADIGELDKWGGHSGRADDYHYHLAPEHLEEIVGEGNPVAYALDGFPLYGKTDHPLDEYLGRFNESSSYQYHAADYPPYLIAGLRGEVQVDSLANAPEDQIEPQPRSQPVRTKDYGPLNGAEITGFNNIGENSYSLEYAINNKTQQVNYQWNENGEYRFVFVDAQGNETIENYQANNANPPTPPAAPPALRAVPDIKANQSDKPITINSTDHLSISIALNSNGQNDNADWWLVANTPVGLFSYQEMTGWQASMVPMKQAALATLPQQEILNSTGLSAGAYTLYFGFDNNPNGELDLDQIVYDYVNILSEANTDADFEATDWTDETHSKKVDPNFDEVFDDTQVKRLDFVVTEARWQSMLDDMTATYGEFGRRVNGQQGLSDTDEDPIFVPADIFYNGKQWYRAGIRFKGNSSLQSSWRAGILKLSFKLDFDEFEDDYPQIDNQRFYGFKKFSLKNNYDDKSFMREKVAADVFKNAGVPVSHTAFYTLYIDHGNGPEYFGLYTLVEEVDGPVLDTQFSSDEGNLYKPEDGSANFVAGTFNPEDFTKKTNEDDEDWSDIIALFDALHDDTATTDPVAWRTNLDAVFDVDGYLKYLAVNGIIQNWDTYGRMIHNYYLYNNPENNKLTWIPWDNNEALQTGKQGGAVALDFSDMNASEWPLIAKIYADDEYKARYDDYLFEVITNAFETSSIQATYDDYSSLIAPYATSERAGYSFLKSSDDFYNTVDTLKSHATSRATAVSSYLLNSE